MFLGPGLRRGTLFFERTITIMKRKPTKVPINICWGLQSSQQLLKMQQPACQPLTHLANCLTFLDIC